MWKCPGCGESVDPEFDVCWQCGTASDGTRDPNFQTADEAGPIEDPALDLESATLDDNPLDEIPEPLDNLVECYAASDIQEARFVADQLVLRGIPAVADHINPNDFLGGWRPVMWGYGPRVRIRARDADAARVWVEEYVKKQKEKRQSQSSG